MISHYSKLKFILTNDQKKSLYYITFLLFIGMFFEIFGLGVIFPFILSIVNPEELYKIEIISKIIENFQLTSNSEITFFLLSLLLIVFLIKTIFLVFLAYKQNQFLGNFISKISTRLYQLYLDQNLLFHVNINSSILIKTIQNEVIHLSAFCMSLITITIEGGLALSILFTLLVIEPIGALTVGCYFFILSIIYFLTVKPFIIRWGKYNEILTKKGFKIIVEGLNTVKELILYRATNQYINKLQGIFNERASVVTKNGTLQFLPRLFLELSAVLGMVLFIFVMILNQRDSSIIVSIIGIFIAAIFRIVPSANRIIVAIQKIGYYQPSINIIFNDFSSLKNRSSGNVKENEIILKDKIVFKNIFFKYNDKDPSWILENLNFSIRKGEFIGVKGESGSGKSTMISLIAGLFIPNKGSVYIDGNKINLDVNSWYRQIGYVSQSIFLTDSTIKENIVLGINNKDIESKKINNCLKDAGLFTFIKSLPNGIDTKIGENGVNLSGGQRQRIGIARALYNSPKILLFDEATSALDNANEEKIMKSILKLREEKTIVFISHNLSTLRYCDSVYEIKNRNLIKTN